jgi:hypothetical protein
VIGSTVNKFVIYNIIISSILSVFIFYPYSFVAFFITYPGDL